MPCHPASWGGWRGPWGQTHGGISLFTNCIRHGPASGCSVFGFIIPQPLSTKQTHIFQPLCCTSVSTGAMLIRDNKNGLTSASHSIQCLREIEGPTRATATWKRRGKGGLDRDRLLHRQLARTGWIWFDIPIDVSWGCHPCPDPKERIGFNRDEFHPQWMNR